MSYNKRALSGIFCVIGGMLIMITYGYFYTVVEQTSAVWLTSVAISFEAVAMPLGGLLAKKIGFRLVVIASCILQSGGIALTYFAIKGGFIATVITYGVIQGFGFGFGYAVIISTAAMWFPLRRGLIVGLVVGGFGAGALIFTPVQTMIINPTNLEVNNVTKTFTDVELLNRVPMACVTLAIIMASIQFVGILMMRERPTETPKTEDDEIEKVHLKSKMGEDLASGEEPEKHMVDENLARGDEPEKLTPDVLIVSDQQIQNQDENNVVDIPPLQALRTMDFYLLWFSVCFAVVPITTVSSLYKLVGIEFIRDDQFLAGVAMAGSLCNAGGRVVWGLICDKLSFKLPMCCMFILWTVMLCSFPHLSFLTGVMAKVVYTFWVAMLFFCLSGVFIFAPTATEVLFGPHNMAVNYGLIYNAFIVGSMFASVMNNLPIFGGGPTYAFGMSGLMCIFALLIAIWITDRKTPRKCSILNAPARLRKRLSARCPTCCTCCQENRKNQSNQPEKSLKV